MIITNLVVILLITITLSIFIRKTIYPVNEITNKIKNFNSSKKAKYDIEEISYYNKKDEI
jgi:cell division protein FtsL